MRVEFRPAGRGLATPGIATSTFTVLNPAAWSRVGSLLRQRTATRLRPPLLPRARGGKTLRTVWKMRGRERRGWSFLLPFFVHGSGAAPTANAVREDELEASAPWLCVRVEKLAASGLSV